MALFIPHRCPKCFESVTLIQPQYKGGAFKGVARGQCLNCMDEQEYDLTIPANKKDLINIKKQNGGKRNWKARGHCVFCGWREEIDMYSKDRENVR